MFFIPKVSRLTNILNDNNTSQYFSWIGTLTGKGEQLYIQILTQHSFLPLAINVSQFFADFAGEHGTESMLSSWVALQETTFDLQHGVPKGATSGSVAWSITHPVIIDNLDIVLIGLLMLIKFIGDVGSIRWPFPFIAPQSNQQRHHHGVMARKQMQLRCLAAWDKRMITVLQGRN